MRSLKEIRLQLGWSFAEMGELLGLKRATYQTYDDGRVPPPHILELAQKSLEIVQRQAVELKEKYRPGGIAEQEINKKYPIGFMSGE